MNAFSMSTSNNDGDIGSSCLLEFLCDGGDLLHSVLVGSQVALEGLVLPHQGSDLHQRGRLVVLLGQQLFLTWNTSTHPFNSNHHLLFALQLTSSVFVSLTTTL